jgi:hypothetical protein
VILTELNFEREHSTLSLSGRFWTELWDGDVMLDAWATFNGITTPAINDLLDDYFSNGTTPTAWYIGLIDNTGFSSVSASDTMSSHAGWTELTGYSESTRPAWGPGNAAGGIKTNASPVIFTATSDIVVAGHFTVSNNTKGGSTGVLWNTAVFTSEKSVSVGQRLRVYYELRGRDG